jgi:hypothetical protein
MSPSHAMTTRSKVKEMRYLSSDGEHLIAKNSVSIIDRSTPVPKPRLVPKTKIIPNPLPLKRTIEEKKEPSRDEGLAAMLKPIVDRYHEAINQIILKMNEEKIAKLQELTVDRVKMREDHKKEVRELNTDLEECKTVINMLHTKYKAMIEELKGKHSWDVGEYQVDVINKNARIEYLEQRVNILDANNEAIHRLNNSLRKKIRDAEGEIRGLKDQVAELENMIDILDPQEPPSPPHHPDPVFDDSYRPAKDHTMDSEDNSDGD